MSTRMTTAAALVAIVAAVPPAFAADPNPAVPLSPMMMHGSLTTTRLQPGQIRGSELKGAAIYDRDDRKIASVRDMILDSDGRIAQVVLDVDGKHVALDMMQLTIATDQKQKPHIAVEMTKDQLKAAQPFDPDAKAASGGSALPAQRNR